MIFYLYLAIKNALRQKKRSFTLGINYTIVTFILVLLLSFSEGVKVNITDNVAQSNAGHITLSGEYYIDGKAYKGILDYPKIEQTIGDTFEGRTTIRERYIMNSAMYYKGVSKRLQFTGIFPESDSGYKGQIAFLKGTWEEFASAPNGVLLPEAVAVYFGLSYGDDVLISTRTRFGAFNTATLSVRGIYTTANFFIQSQVLSHFVFLQDLDLAPDNAASVMYLYFEDTRSLSEKRDLLMNALAQRGFRTQKPANDTEALNAITAASPRYKKVESTENHVDLVLATLDEALGLVRTILAAVNGIGIFIALVMLFIIAVSVFINLRMTINDRLGEIGTLRTIGMESISVTALFIVENIVLSLIFILLGIALALAVVLVASLVVPVPALDVLSLFVKNNHFVLVPRFDSIALVAIVILAFSAIFSYFPARYGGKIRPVDALNKVF